MKNVAIVTGATSGYFDLLGDLLSNLLNLSVFDDCDVHVFDVDFDDEQIALIRRYPVSIRKIDFEPLEISCPDPRRRHVVSTIRPVMRDVFPGYPTYIYLDVDVWLQDRSAIADFVAAASDKALVLVPENTAVGGVSVARSWQRKHVKFYGQATAGRMAGRTNWNGGVLALDADSPAWKVWAREYQAAVASADEWFGAGQSAFTYLDMTGAMTIRSLPPVYNWLIAYAPPRWDDFARQYVSPMTPHEKIFVMHQNHKAKYRKFNVRFTDGRSAMTTYRYPAYLELRQGRYEMAPWWQRFANFGRPG